MHSDKIYIERDPSLPWKHSIRRRVHMPHAIMEALAHGLEKAELKYGMSSPEAKEIRLLIADLA